jgi:hypothetical protein
VSAEPSYLTSGSLKDAEFHGHKIADDRTLSTTSFRDFVVRRLPAWSKFLSTLCVNGSISPYSTQTQKLARLSELPPKRSNY